MVRPAELHGDRRAITLVTCAALEIVHPLAPAAWLRRLTWVHQGRRAAVRELCQAALGESSRAVSRAGERYGVGGTLWWIGMISGAVAVIAGAALLLPPRHSSARTIEDGMPPTGIEGAS